ncbi:mediator of DNA damage checkpoint protein 1 isoform X7 [Bufo bufo]|uniref:mediator of DNA damage checkpoint protein 1 isoform X6 n=1 Tax=Bufo bufo TaxID=8384 RepID=UPI001ABE013C|nr:mediator of DNA damage checkpoint protein 1 isoform X6 [Bufo bufo]XP_040261761.1 mediator of DNA damage checkpoint protein 1 isoform X7 [Bufo bufo]
MMDDTQRLDYNDDEEEPSANRDRPMGNLHMFAGIHGGTQDFPIYRGQNIIGRHANCDITLPAQSVSKKHAILEVRGDCHTICDNNSLNKTRRGKTALAPNVHYALSDGDFLLFADVACRYTIVKVQAEATEVEDSEDDSVLVPATQGALAIEKTPGAAIRRIARGIVLARDSGDEENEEEEEGQTRWHEGGSGSVRDGHKTSGSGTTFPPDADTIVPESDEENDTSTSEMPLPSLSLRCDSDTDTSRRSSFVPSSQSISTPLPKSKHDGRTAVDKEEMIPRKPEDGEIKTSSAVEENQEEQKASTSGGSVSQPEVGIVSTVESERMLQHKALKEPCSESKPASSPCVEVDNVALNRSENVQETPSELKPNVDVKVDHVSLDSAANIQEDTTTSGSDVNTAETSEIQTNKSKEEGDSRSSGSREAAFHMDSDTDEDEAESDLEKSKSLQVAYIEKSEKNASVPVTCRKEGDSDSDTDVEDDQNVKKSKSDNDEAKRTMGEPIKTEGTPGLSLDSDTDDDDDADEPKPLENKADQDSRSNTDEKKEGFHMDSDTDVEEEVFTAEVKEAKPEPLKTSAKETKGVLNLDSDTDVDEEDNVSSRHMTHGLQDSSTASTNVQDATGVESDTNVDEDEQIPGGAKDNTDVVEAKEALHVGSDTDDDNDDRLPVVPPLEKVRAPEVSTDSAVKDTEIAKEPADLHLDSDTDVEESDARAEEDEMDTTGSQEEADQKTSVSSVNEIAAVSGSSAEETKNIPTEVSMDEDETQKSDSESVDLEMMPTQCYLEPEAESELPDEEEEEATQAYIFSSTWAEPNPFKSPADPIGVLQISSVTSVNTSEEEIDENALAETQAFCTEAERVGPSVQETPELVERSLDESMQSTTSEKESGKEVQQLSHQTMSPDATQPVSQCLSSRQSEETGTWMHLKREVPASVWIRGIQQGGDSTDLEGGSDATQAEDQSLNLELEATQIYGVESPSEQKPLAHTEIQLVPAAGEDKETPTMPAAGKDKETPTVPTADKDYKEPNVPAETTEQPLSDDIQASDNDATQAYSLDVPGSGSGTQACVLSDETTSDATQATNVYTVATEDNAQVAGPSVPNAEEVVPEKSTESKKKLPLRKGLSRSKKKVESAKNVPQTSSEIEECPGKDPVGPGSLKEEPGEQGAGEPQLSEPGIQEVQVERGLRRGGRRIAESQTKTTVKEEIHVATTSRKTTSKTSDDEPSASGINEKRGRRQVSRKTAVKVVDEVYKEEHKQSSSNTEEAKEGSAPEILPINSPEEIESLNAEDHQKGNTAEQTSKESSDQSSLENKDILSTEAFTSSAVSESNNPMESNDNSADKESDSRDTNVNEKPGRNKRRVATRLESEAADKTEFTDNLEKEKDESRGRCNVRTTRKTDTSKQSSESPQSQQITQEQSQGRKATRKSRTKPSGPQSDKVEDTTISVTDENKKVDEICPADSVSGNEKPRRTRRSLKEEIEEESENLQDRDKKGKNVRSASVKDAEPRTKDKEQGNLEDLAASNKISRRTRNNPKGETTKPEQVKEENEVVKKSRRTQKNLKEEQKTEDNTETQGTSSSETPTSRRTRKENREEDSVVKEETVKETTPRRTRRHSKEDSIKLEDDQTKRSRRTRRDSKEEAKTQESVEESVLEENKEETVGRKTTRKTRKNVKDDEKTILHEESKQTEDNSKSERSSRTRVKASDENRELHEEGVNKGVEESQKLSPHKEKSKPAVGRGRRAAKKEDTPEVSTPVASRKRGQAAKAEVEIKRKKSDEGEEQEKLEVVETPKRGRPRKLVTQTESPRAGKEISTPDPSPSRSTRQRSSSALSNPPEAITPRRTNRMSTSTTSPYVAQSGSAPKILFTGVVDTAGEETIRSLGAEIAESVFDCTHLVTDRVRRTVKFLCALARGIPIVTLDWIDKCKKSGCFLSPTGFLVNDKEQEKNFSFTLSESLQKAKRRPLLEGYEIHVTANVKPEPDHMKDIIRCSGATFLSKMPRSFKDKCVVVSCPEDAARCKSVPASVPITSAEFILSGILRQEVNPTAHLLNPAVQDSGPPPAKRRR